MVRTHMKKLTHILLLLATALPLLAQSYTAVTFSNTADWTTNDLRQYVGQTVRFTQPIYICNNYYSTPSASFHRVMSPTNQATPLSAEYNHLVSIQKNETFSLSGLSGYHRMGELIYGAVAKINSTSSVQILSYDHITGTRADMQAGIPNVDLMRDPETDTIVRHDLLVCAANLEYYLVENLGTGYGPDNQAQHNIQRAKVSAGLSKIRADIYGIVEVEQGQAAMAELASDLTRLTGRQYSYINDGGSASGSYTKSAYIYCSDVVRPYGDLKSNNTGVNNRKKMQGFEVIRSGERFIFSLNHFKAKSGTGTGSDANQNDGQGSFNGSRVTEANSVVSAYNSNRIYYGDEDILIMGDLNAYAKEDPIMVFLNHGMTDLHRYFHADSSYSYTYHGQAGYLDHAICNSTMLAQVTGMAAYHLNSDESDDYTYDGSKSESTMFRYSDHDPVLVGLKMGASFSTPIHELTANDVEMQLRDGKPIIFNGKNGYYRLYTLNGQNVCEGSIHDDAFTIDQTLQPGMYILNVYANGGVARQKYFFQ